MPSVSRPGGTQVARGCAGVRLGGAVGAQRVRIADEPRRRRVAAAPRRCCPRSESIVPPLRPPRAVATSRTSRRPPAPSAARALVQQQDARGRTGSESKPQACTIRAPVPRARASYAVDRLADEQHLAGEVGVVRPGPRAGLDQRQPVPGVRADRRRHHRVAAASAASDAGSAASATSSGQSARRRGSASRTAASRVPRAPGEGDAGARRRVLGEMCGGQRSDEPGRAVDDDVVASRIIRHRLIVVAPNRRRAAAPAARVGPPAHVPGRHGIGFAALLL